MGYWTGGKATDGKQAELYMIGAQWAVYNRPAYLVVSSVLLILLHRGWSSMNSLPDPRLLDGMKEVAEDGEQVGIRRPHNQ